MDHSDVGVPAGTAAAQRQRHPRPALQFGRYVRVGHGLIVPRAGAVGRTAPTRAEGSAASWWRPPNPAGGGSAAVSADQERRQLRAAVAPDCHVAVFETVGQSPWHVDPCTRRPHLVDDEVPTDGLAQLWLGEWPWPVVGIRREGV